MGTPDFAVASLKGLLDAGFQVVAVVTAPDRPAGRGMRLQMSAVKQYAVGHHIPVLQPEKLKDPVFLETLRGYQADLQVVVAFRMLPEVVWNMPPMGSVNLHGSLLPQYRGAAPINWAIIHGEHQTGVTTFRLTHEIDTGDILLQESLPITPEDTAGSLHDRMKEAGAILLVKTVRGLAEGTLKPRPQSFFSQDSTEAPIHSAPKIHTETCRIQWERTPVEIVDLIRGLSPYPGAFTELNGKKLKIFRAQSQWAPHSHAFGSVLTDHKTFLKFACAQGYVLPLELQLEGKKPMNLPDFLRGWRI